MAENGEDRPIVLFVCTGNAARSVMAATMLRARTSAVQIHSAGTHSIPGLPMSTRTRSALERFDVSDPDHRSLQLEAEHAEAATAIVVFEPMHLSYVRKKHPDVASRVASLTLLAERLEPGPLATLPSRLEQMQLGTHTFEAWEEVVDPAGGELPEFEAAATQIDLLVASFLQKIGR